MIDRDVSALREWQHRPHRKPLVIRGARQVDRRAHGR
jgi:hypothetical protein